MARFIKQKHVTIIRFLRILGVGEKNAKLDAEGIEHHVHKDTVNRMERFVDFVGKHPLGSRYSKTQKIEEYGKGLASHVRRELRESWSFVVRKVCVGMVVRTSIATHTKDVLATLAETFSPHHETIV